MVFGDLHFGQATAIINKGKKSKGISKYVKQLVVDIDHISKQIPVKFLILNGDIKHETKNINAEESNDLKYFFTQETILKKQCILIKGNHDKLLKLTVRSFLPKNCEIIDFYKCGPYLIHHGHDNYEPSTSSVVILSHEHPSYILKGNNFERVKLPAFVTIQDEHGRNIVILPSVSDISSGIIFPPNSFMSPFLRSINPKLIQIYPYSRETGVLPIPAICK